MSMLALADGLENAGLDIADTVVEISRIRFEKPPSVAQLYDVARQVRIDENPTRMSLPSADGIPMPPEVKAKYVRMVDNLAGEQVRKATEHEQEIEEQEQEWRRLRAASLSMLRDVKACPGFGQPAAEREGKWVCPGCGVEIVEEPVEADR